MTLFRKLAVLALLALPAFADVIVDGKVVQSSNCRLRGIGSVLTVYGCSVNLGNYPITVQTATFTLTAATGTGTVKLYQTSTGVIVLEHPNAAGLTITATNGSVLAVPTPQVPPLEARAIGEATNTGLTWGGVTSYGDMPMWVPMVAGSGIVISQTGGIAMFSVSPDVVLKSGSNTMLGSYDFTSATVTGLGDSYNPLTTQRWVEPFSHGPVTGNGTIGQLGWATASQGTTSFGLVAGKGSYVARSTGTTAGVTAPLYLSPTPQSIFSTADTFDKRWIFQLSTVDADTTARVGANCSAGMGTITISDGFYLEKIPANTNWFVVVRTASADVTSVDTGVAANASNLVYVRMRKVSGTTYWSINGGAETALANVPASASCQPWTAVYNGAATASKTLRHFYFDLNVTGLTRP